MKKKATFVSVASPIDLIEIGFDRMEFESPVFEPVIAY